ncbi:hypothetical protein TrLO_g2781 [Triparma laevis f. longispina]|uniref:Uncharacterized protein n=1 Tax=Triparma laevis f. longispina TaxID=1714387 RepID=A0A9W7L027_9STRA|nr:hypothetical protein TrLO_g2781 [Triparma laevis f. longispina]
MSKSTLMALRVVTKGFNVAADTLIDEGVRSGDLMVHDGKDIHMLVAVARKERCKLATRVIFFLNITKVGKFACYYAANLVVVDIPEGVEEIRWNAFAYCSSLTTYVFVHCYKLVPSNIRTNDNDAVVDHLRSQQQIS